MPADPLRKSARPRSFQRPQNKGHSGAADFPVKAFKITSAADIAAAEQSAADYILLDSGTGTGVTFDHSLISSLTRPYFLAGGLTAQNVGEAVETLQPFAVDASSSLETKGQKDKNKMTEFVNAVRKKG